MPPQDLPPPGDHRTERAFCLWGCGVWGWAVDGGHPTMQKDGADCVAQCVENRCVSTLQHTAHEQHAITSNKNKPCSMLQNTSADAGGWGCCATHPPFRHAIHAYKQSMYAVTTASKQQRTGKNVLQCPTYFRQGWRGLHGMASPHDAQHVVA